MIAWIKTYAAHHLFYILLLAVGLIAFRSWLQEHDARLAADSVIKQQQAQIADIQAQAKQKVQVVTQIVREAVTPSQVVAALPKLTDLPLNVREVPGNPQDVQVAAQPLVQLAGDDKATHIQLEACQQIGEAKDKEIVALKKKPSFWKRALGTTKVVVVSVAAGLVLHAVL